MAKRTPSDIELDLIFIGVDPADQRVARSLIAGGLSTPFRDASAGVMVLSAVVHLDWLDGAA
jgi:hypothetical protein